MNIVPLGAGGSLPVTPATQPAGRSEAPLPFTKLIDGFLQNAQAEHVKADEAVRDLAMGATDNIHDVMLSVARADLSFRLILEIRNRLTEAYQDIMRMQV